MPVFTRMWINVTVKMTLTGAAVINVGLAVDSTVPRMAFAVIAALRVHTMSPILTRAPPALIDIFCALGSYMYIVDKKHLY